MPTGSFVAFSNDAPTWTKPEIVSEPGRWLWRVTWHEGKAYGISYASVRPKDADLSTQLVVSDDGLKFHALVPKLFGEGNADGGHAAIWEGRHDVLFHCRDGKPTRPSAFLGMSERLTPNGNGMT